MGQAAVKAYKGMGMEGFVARWYASTTLKDLKEHQLLARRVADELPAGAKVLEVAPGPGYFAIELAKLGRDVTGLDISHTLVEIARRNAAEANVKVDFRLGNASRMPFPEGAFAFLLCRAAFKNFSEPVRALQEMHRVLRPGGKALIIDLRRDAAREAINQYVDGLQLSWASAIFTKGAFRFMLLKRAYTKDDFERMISQTGFRKFEIRQELIGMEISLER
ncbi:MAG TPA: class I SAM-dependent methyltransferase [Bryobacteraceae bacterium]|jgi:ubiquinone/menaquinone biosynthesis C-methylase UbiE|nr:class I SAM-dependent methyltransferase [Bryobacteraceae bacterium]